MIYHVAYYEVNFHTCDTYTAADILSYWSFALGIQVRKATKIEALRLALKI